MLKTDTRLLPAMARQPLVLENATPPCMNTSQRTKASGGFVREIWEIWEARALLTSAWSGRAKAFRWSRASRGTAKDGTVVPMLRLLLRRAVEEEQRLAADERRRQRRELRIRQHTRHPNTPRAAACAAKATASSAAATSAATAAAAAAAARLIRWLAPSQRGGAGGYRGLCRGGSF